MKAIVVDHFLSSHNELSVSSIPTTKHWSPSSVLIRVSHVSPQYVDLLYARGLHQNNSPRGHVHPPFVLGYDFAGTVISSPAFSAFKPGDVVYGSALGAFAEVVVAEEKDIRHVPRELGNAGATALVGGMTSYAAVVAIAEVRASDTVLVIGAAGGLGVVACQVAAACGAHVIGVVGSAAKADVLRREVGVEDVAGYNKEGWEKRIIDFTEDGRGVDVVIDVVGKVESGLRCLRYGGRIVVLGFAGREGNMEAVKMNRILLKGASVIGYRYGEHGRRFPQETAALLDGFNEMVANGKIKPIIYKEKYTGLEDVPRAMNDLAERKVWGKAVIAINPEIEKPKL
ncbi:hypothetical protein LTR04_002136 [Oleoguttula sp. CCFEE 6159]|nr:hypothetical protein LTR04_002136 [Oleoguttula sp. CCFEE 6159]